MRILSAIPIFSIFVYIQELTEQDMKIVYI